MSAMQAHLDRTSLQVKPLPDHSNEDCSALIIGNSKALWQPFLRWIKSFPVHVTILPSFFGGNQDSNF